ncbi:T5orf172 domain-containing protein [Stachybotrys elegans]|uniref:T5orf172 domain-containing protein n=1 Tax=Stachybotrys elegans TaxID=80388 RepID=A0A8K0SJC6_9HYPO|nr:T5orf172 domain-containing protein [Stachybotrys elegans]
MMQGLDETFFISVQELNASSLDQCIHFTRYGKRCKWSLKERDLEKARVLRDQVVSAAGGTVELDLLQRYALSNCCSKAQHRNRLEDRGLLAPLAIRWQQELQQHQRTEPERSTIGVAKELEQESKLDSNPNSGSPLPTDTGRRYNLRQKTNTMSALVTQPVPQTPLSEFRPHLTEPGDDDTVSFKIRGPLERRDFRSGKLYMFKRESSPGHVKIGWTSQRVQGRLEEWAKCGYTPELLFQVDNVPHAQRAETLIHYEMIKEWRAERMCKAPSCGKSHREWFQVEEQRAKQVILGWALFFKTAVPYVDGLLKEEWRQVIDTMDKRGELITGKALLEIDVTKQIKSAEVLATQLPIKEEQLVLAKPPDINTAELGETDNQGAKVNQSQDIKLSFPMSANPVATSDLLFQPIKEESRLPELRPMLSELTSKLPTETLSEQPMSTVHFPSFSTSRVLDSGFPTPNGLPSPSITSDSEWRFQWNFSPPKTPSRPVIASEYRPKVSLKKSRVGSIFIGEGQTTGASISGKPVPELIPLPPSPPLSPLDHVKEL